MTVAFDYIPGAGLKAPLVTFELVSGGQFTSQSRLLLVGHKVAAGTLAEAVPTYCGTQEEADLLAGSGSMLREMFRIARANAPVQEIWIVAAAATGVAGIWTGTVGTPPADGGAGVIEIAGQSITVDIGAGDDAATVAAAIRDAINDFYDPLTGATLPVTATAATNVVTVTARHAGLALDDLDLHVPTTTPGNAFAGVLTIAHPTAGTGSPDLSAALASLGDDAFDLIVSPFSDATNLGRYQTLLGDVSGRWSYARQLYGHVVTAAVDTTSGLTTLGLGRNDRHVTIVGRIASSGDPNPGYAWATAMAARVMPWLFDGATGNASRNHTGLVLEGIRAPRDRSKWVVYATRNTFLKSGISTWQATLDGSVSIDKLVTTYRTNALGQPDEVFADIQWVGQMTYGLRYMRAQVSYEHSNKAIADENPGGDDAITTPADIEATIIHAYEALSGIFEGAGDFADTLVVERSQDSPNRVDVKMKIDRVNPLDVFAAQAVLYSQIAAAA